MEEFVKADIFFFVSTIAVFVLTVALVVFIYYIIKILRNVRDVSEIVKNLSKSISEDISELRIYIKKEGLKWQNILEYFKKRKRRTKK